ncbi:DUF305 domain-containing protein [Nocardioides sp. AX2bis]|uniref:DUF305 domain-containing protein n=1 Tax=Nocardioides sp. AX2bis TaxID=2653157 RepID=UPI0012F251FC|nr:DUF305 domain-containing protein [Nocardioides sp. AX2bis]VXB27409.1 conserved exported hypothetical protein [Nocardioides sp. AX2bis]
MRSNRTTRAISATALGLTLAVTAAACGNDTGSDTSAQVSTTEHNDADVAFASEMLQHHAQALTMVDLTMGRDLDPEVRQLAEDIRGAQAPEIETFTDWLTDWDEEIPSTMRDHANADHEDGEAGAAMEGMDAGAMDMPGMMSAADMTALEDAPDPEFQDMWLEMMIEHHTGAIDMAEAETDQGQYKPAIDLAEEIADSQTVEIDTMETLLAS